MDTLHIIPSPLQVVITAVIQGITEFIPVSSSAHLFVVPHFFGLPDQPPLYEAMLHLGTLFAVVVYFYKDLLRLTVNLGFIVAKPRSDEAREVFRLLLATLPVIFAGFFVHKYLIHYQKVPLLIGSMSILFGILLYLSDRVGRRPLVSMNLGESLVVGFCQALAVIPGGSRSGLCLTALRSQGFARGEAARFCFLLSLPPVLGAVTLRGLDVLKLPLEASMPIIESGLYGMAIAFIVGLACIHGMMRWLSQHSFRPFAIYRILFGSLLIIAHFWL